MALIDSVAVSNLGFGGQDPALTNATPSGELGGAFLEGSLFDLDNGATPPKYLDNPPA